MKRVLLSVQAFALSDNPYLPFAEQWEWGRHGRKLKNRLRPIRHNPVVYMTRDFTPEMLMAFKEALGRGATGNVAVKLSTGEPDRVQLLLSSLIEYLVKRKTGLSWNAHCIWR